MLVLKGMKRFLVEKKCLHELECYIKITWCACVEGDDEVLYWEKNTFMNWCVIFIYENYYHSKSWWWDSCWGDLYEGVVLGTHDELAYTKVLGIHHGITYIQKWYFWWSKTFNWRLNTRTSFFPPGRLMQELFLWKYIFSYSLLWCFFSFFFHSKRESLSSFIFSYSLL